MRNTVRRNETNRDLRRAGMTPEAWTDGPYPIPSSSFAIAVHPSLVQAVRGVDEGEIRDGP